MGRRGVVERPAQRGRLLHQGLGGGQVARDAHIGIVDAVEGDRIRLTRNDPDAEGKHHYLPLDMIKRVEGNTVRLSCTVDQAHDRWSEEAGPDGKSGSAPRGVDPGSSRGGP